MNCRISDNLKYCNCSYPCDNHGLCCKCLHYHRMRGELPACYFDEKMEKLYDRSIELFIKINKRNSG